MPLASVPSPGFVRFRAYDTPLASQEPEPLTLSRLFARHVLSHLLTAKSTGKLLTAMASCSVHVVVLDEITGCSTNTLGHCVQTTLFVVVSVRSADPASIIHYNLYSQSNSFETFSVVSHSSFAKSSLLASSLASSTTPYGTRYFPL